MTVSTHVLDTHRGCPAAGVPVRLDRYGGETWRPVAEGPTDDRGRWAVPGSRDTAPEPGTYRLRFGTGPYFAALGVETCFPEVMVIFVVGEDGRHHHVPLLLSPFGYSAYRGD